MTIYLRRAVLSVAGAVVSGCITAAPGAAQVTMTRNPNDVSACAAVGNINAQAMRSPLMAQNQAVGLNANVVLNTGAGGVAYRCEKGKAIPGQ